VGVFGIACAIVVYAAIGERKTAGPAARPTRFDPKSILESAGAALQQFQNTRQDYAIEADRQVTYEGGATKFVGVRIKVRQRAGRDFVVSGREAQAGEEQKDLEITGDVKLTASDGFIASAEHATFSNSDATVRITGPVSFEKGRMTGSGIGMTYDQNTDVLALLEQARVTVTDESGKPVNDFNAGSAILDRAQHFLELSGNVHALQGEQALDADNAKARLSNSNEVVTFIELRGNARTEGGHGFDSMSAKDIDLDYTDAGNTLERVTLNGMGAIALSGQDGGSGRQFLGDFLELAFASDATVTHVAGKGGVQVDLPAGKGGPARKVTSKVFDADGEAGKDLTGARFTDAVEYREDGGAGKMPRLAHSTSLRIGLAGDAVTAADFMGSVRFEEEGLQASAAQAHYDPAKGTLHLNGSDAGGGPRVSDPEIDITADVIDVTLENRRMAAKGGIKTVLKTSNKKLPGLLEQGQAANVNADALDYAEAGGKAVYSGNATLWQGETAIRADVITLDQTRADLLASGAARSNIVLDTGVSIGRADEIRYDDAARTIAYGAVAPTAARPVAPTPAGPIAPPIAQLSGPQGDLRAARLEVILAKEASRMERLEAYTGVNVRLDTKVATGDRLTYNADGEKYTMTGVATVPVKVVEECRETTGRTVTFFKTGERIIVDGNEQARTESRRGAACAQPPAR
jgi:LPS export ABC transporter protein LptC